MALVLRTIGSYHYFPLNALAQLLVCLLRVVLSAAQRGSAGGDTGSRGPQRVPLVCARRPALPHQAEGAAQPAGPAEPRPARAPRPRLEGLFTRLPYCGGSHESIQQAVDDDDDNAIGFC